MLRREQYLVGRNGNAGRLDRLGQREYGRLAQVGEGIVGIRRIEFGRVGHEAIRLALV